LLRLLSQIEIIQQPLPNWTQRSESFTFNFVNDVGISSSWDNLTDTAKIKLPRKTYFQTGNSDKITWGGDSTSISTQLYADQQNGTAPVLARGDKVSIWLGYWTKEQGQQLPVSYTGYITSINPKIPLEINCEDSMFILKQALCPNMVFPASQWSLTGGNGKKGIIQYLIANPANNPPQQVLNALADIVVVNGVGTSESIETNIGDFRTLNETIAQVLQRLRKDYKIESFFRNHDLNGNPGTFLYCSGIVYYPNDYIKNGNIFSSIFDFQNNIISDNLKYLRTDDLRLGIKAFSVNKNELSSVNSKGQTKTSHKRLETTVGDLDGELRNQFFWNVTDLPTLKALATQRLSKLKFEGWRGNFTTFGLPNVQHGQAVTLKDNIIPERSGTYLVKGVKTTFGINGFRQDIDLHLRIDGGIYQLSDFMNGL
jgi:hypothetical protein